MQKKKKKYQKRGVKHKKGARGCEDTVSKRFFAAAKHNCPLPILADVETPLELEVLLLVVVDKARDGVVVASGEHAGGSLLLLDCGGVSAEFIPTPCLIFPCLGMEILTLLDVGGLLVGVGSIASLYKPLVISDDPTIQQLH